MSTCQYTGIELENKRAKNHPAVTALLTDANKRGVYGAVVAAMNAAKAEGVTGLDVVEVGKAAMKSGEQAAAEFRAQLRAEQNRKRDERSADAQFYQTHGYSRYASTDEDARADIEAGQQYQQPVTGTGTVEDREA